MLLLGSGTSDSSEYNWSHLPHHLMVHWMHLMVLHSQRGTKSNPPLQKYLINKLKASVETTAYSLAVPSNHFRKTRGWHHTSSLIFLFILWYLKYTLFSWIYLVVFRVYAALPGTKVQWQFLTVQLLWEACINQVMMVRQIIFTGYI